MHTLIKLSCDKTLVYCRLVATACTVYTLSFISHSTFHFDKFPTARISIVYLCVCAPKSVENHDSLVAWRTLSVGAVYLKFEVKYIQNH